MEKIISDHVMKQLGILVAGRTDLQEDVRRAAQRVLNDYLSAQEVFYQHNREVMKEQLNAHEEIHRHLPPQA